MLKRKGMRALYFRLCFLQIPALQLGTEQIEMTRSLVLLQRTVASEGSAASCNKQRRVCFQVTFSTTLQLDHKPFMRHGCPRARPASVKMNQVDTPLCTYLIFDFVPRSGFVREAEQATSNEMVQLCSRAQAHDRWAMQERPNSLVA